MMTNDILQEKNRVQKLLSESAKNMHDYFAKMNMATSRKLLRVEGKEHEYSPCSVSPVLQK